MCEQETNSKSKGCLGEIDQASIREEIIEARFNRLKEKAEE